MEETIESLEKKREHLYRDLHDIGDFRRGIISVIYRKCGKKYCACTKEGHPGHGPPPIPISTRAATCTDDILSLKLMLGDHIIGRDILTLNGPKVTTWGKEYLDQVAAYLDIIVSAHERNTNANLLVQWSKTSHQYPYQVFRGTVLLNAASISAYCFSNNADAMTFVSEKTRDAENSVRDEMNIPKIGEGWVSETDLYYSLRNTLSGLEIVHHARPDWLRKQHLDIFIPSLLVALEFQGQQHHEPVDYFGGENAFKQTQARDTKKKRSCTKNGIRLVYVRPGYDLPSLIDEIMNGRKQEGEEKHPITSRAALDCLNL